MSKATKGKTTVTKEFNEDNARCAFEAIARIFSAKYGVDIEVESIQKRGGEGVA